MKQLLIVITLVVASAAPAVAEGFPNSYLTHRSLDGSEPHHTFPQRRTPMKTIFLALALAFAFAAPSMALEFSNQTVGVFSR